MRNTHRISVILESSQMVITTNQSSLVSLSIAIKGTAGKIINWQWGDGTSTVTTLSGTGTTNTITKSYSSTGIYRITISGDIGEITSWIFDNTTWSVTLDEIGKMKKLNAFSSSSASSISGNLSSLPSGLSTVVIGGSNTVTGNLSSLPSGLSTVYITGSNTITGNLSSLPSGLSTVTITGSNTVTGNLSSLPSGLSTVVISGSNTVADYTSPRTWANNMVQVYMRQAAGYGLSTSEVDNLLIDLSAVPTWTSSKSIDLRGVNAARSSASDAAVAILVSKGVTVLTN